MPRSTYPRNCRNCVQFDRNEDVTRVVKYRIQNHMLKNLSRFDSHTNPHKQQLGSQRENETMITRTRILAAVLVCICPAVFAGDAPTISHGPMLGAVSEHRASIWVRTTIPANVACTLSEVDTAAEPLTKEVRTTSESDNTCIVRFNKLKKGEAYRYVVRVGASKHEATFKTLDPSLTKRSIRLVYGYGYMPRQNRMRPGTSVFMNMALRKPDIVLFLGDFPYTSRGRKEEVRLGNKALRSIVGFRQLTSSTPSYAIYDDHDFGPNDCDGTHKYADEALAAFKEYWPNPSYGLPDCKGNFCSFVVGDVAFFLLDGRYPARKKQKTMLGKIQFDWLCDGLKKSKSRYKVLVSGTQFGRVKDDGWAGKYYVGERRRLFSFILENGISGVIGISGDVHRCDIYKLPMGENRFFYDFTPGALARTQRTPPKRLPVTMIHSSGKKDDNNMFGEIEFSPSSEKDVAITFRSFSAKNGLVYEHTLSPEDLWIHRDTQPNAPAEAGRARR